MHEFLTTREVADLLRIKERKVYELVSEDAIPVSRVTGKLLFPRDLVLAWVRRQAAFRDGIEGLAPPPAVLAGSHDPLLDWALRESGCEIATYFDGSLDGLKRLAAGKALAAGLHVFEPANEDWNVAHLTEALPAAPVVLVEWARRQQGLVVAPDNPRGIAALSDLMGKTLIPRQAEAGSHVLLAHLFDREEVDVAQVTFLDPPARNEADVALAVAEGRADAGLAVETVARQYRLGFVPLFQERYDLVVWRRSYFEPAFQGLLVFCRSKTFQERAASFGGYDVGGLGTVHYNGP